jgi:hypothetical protein
VSDLWALGLLRWQPEQHGDESETQTPEVIDRLYRKRAVVQELVAGRLGLPEAATRFRALDRASPSFHWGRFRDAYPGGGDEERHCREVITPSSPRVCAPACWSPRVARARSAAAPGPRPGWSQPDRPRRRTLARHNEREADRSGDPRRRLEVVGPPPRRSRACFSKNTPPGGASGACAAAGTVWGKESEPWPVGSGTKEGKRSPVAGGPRGSSPACRPGEEAKVTYREVAGEGDALVCRGRSKGQGAALAFLTWRSAAGVRGRTGARGLSAFPPNGRGHQGVARLDDRRRPLRSKPGLSAVGRQPLRAQGWTITGQDGDGCPRTRSPRPGRPSKKT